MPLGLRMDYYIPSIFIDMWWGYFFFLSFFLTFYFEQVYHGDVKLENVMVSSWNWLLLADFATIKPTTLPENDPADFTYFFDTSRRRTCYLAPERFVTILVCMLNHLCTHACAHTPLILNLMKPLLLLEYIHINHNFSCFLDLPNFDRWNETTRIQLIGKTIW